MSQKVTNFNELLDILHQSEPQPNPHYYSILISNAKLIVLETSRTTQHLVAKQLGMDRLRLSHLMPLLRELSYAD